MRGRNALCTGKMLLLRMIKATIEPRRIKSITFLRQKLLKVKVYMY